MAQQFNLLIDEPLKKYTSFNVGGPADLLALPGNLSELKGLLKQASALNIPVTLLGGGTNILITDKGIRGLVIITKQLRSEIRFMEANHAEKFIFADAGERLSNVCRFAITHALSGLEFAAGIPGTLGGAIMMNAGIPSRGMADVVASLDILDPETLEMHTIQRKHLNFSYRNLDTSGIVVASKLKLIPGDADNIKKRFNQNLKKKNATQPVSFASAGCFFKNPAQGMSAGEMIEKADLKGKRVGDAKVSEIHANYIVNIGKATCQDILLLKQQIQETVFKKYQVNLKTEVRVKGE